MIMIIPTTVAAGTAPKQLVCFRHANKSAAGQATTTASTSFFGPMKNMSQLRWTIQHTNLLLRSGGANSAEGQLGGRENFK